MNFSRLSPSRLKISVRAALSLLILLAAFGNIELAAAAALPPGFNDALVASVGSPTALAFTPDGRLLVTTQPGQLRVYQPNGALVGTALDLSARLCFNVERGLLGVAVDPNFTTNNYISGLTQTPETRARYRTRSRALPICGGAGIRF